MCDFPTLETDRLLLREIVASDAPDLFAIHGDAEAMRWFGTDPLTDIQQARKTDRNIRQLAPNAKSGNTLGNSEEIG